jgi:hypothetical protein
MHSRLLRDMEYFCLLLEKQDPARIFVPHCKTLKVLPKLTMDIKDKNLLYARKALGGPFQHERYYDEVEKKLLYVQERKWTTKGPI